MNERLKILRGYLKLSQEALGAKLGIKGSSVAHIESGRNSLTDQNILLLCREFGVNEEWLRTGQGEMFVPLGDDFELELIWAQVNLSNKESAEFVKRALRAFWTMSDEEQIAVMKFIDNLSGK